MGANLEKKEKREGGKEKKRGGKKREGREKGIACTAISLQPQDSCERGIRKSQGQTNMLPLLDSRP
jgi:hypothetical protein